MNGYGLTAAVVQALASLAWPAALIWIVWIFRERLGSLLPLLRVKHKDWEASFRLDQAEREAAALPAAREGPAAEPTPEEKSKFEEIASVSPTAAIVELRRELEHALGKLTMQLGLEFRGPPSIRSMTRVLRSRGLIDQQTSALLDDLRVVGNSAAHGGDEVSFTKDDALRFRKLADDVINRLQSPPLITTP